MIHFMLEKLMHKKWMAICLLIGNVLLISITASQYLYREASYKRMLIDEFNQAYDAQWPMTMRISMTTSRYLDAVEMMEELAPDIDSIPAKVCNQVTNVHLRNQMAYLVEEREELENLTIGVGYMTGLEDNVEIIAGRMYSDEIVDGVMEVIINQEALDQLGVLLGEDIVIDPSRNRKGDKAIRPKYIRVVGVFRPVNGEIPYWNDVQKEFSHEAFMAQGVFEQEYLGDIASEESGKLIGSVNNYIVTHDFFYDYTSISTSDIMVLKNTTNKLCNSEKYSNYIKKPDYMSVLETIRDKEKKINQTLFILQIPCLILLCAFIYMISDQMLRMEQNEISMLKSRGSSKLQIIGLYLMQSIVISGVAYIIAIPFAMLICAFLGSARAFLEFDLKYALSTNLSAGALGYALLALLVSIVVTVVPVIKYSNVTIVAAKRAKNATTKVSIVSWVADLIILGIAVYGYYSFSRNTENIREQVISGKGLDPFMYFCATLFILGMGLLFLKIWPYVIKLLYAIKKRRISSSGYVSFLSTMRSIGKQEFIMIFMILTVALGIFYVTIARTIVNNAKINILYLGGCDVVLEEKWKDNSAFVGSSDLSLVTYYEPDYGRFSKIEGVKAATPVIYDKAKVMTGTKVVMTGDIMAIKTKEFGEMTSLDNELLPYSYHTYLNALANVTNGVLLSANAKTQYGYKIGDMIYVEIKDRPVSLEVIGFVDYWPSYSPVTYSVSDLGKVNKENNFLMVANFSYIQKRIGITPYQVWMDYEDSTQGFYDFVRDNEISVKSYVDTVTEYEEIKSDTLFQGTNGILSLSFIVIVSLCAVGYLIYWIMSIRSRELLFGILRAMGMNKQEIIHILANEQIFCGISSIFAGVGIGALTSIMFVPMIQNAYAATDQIMPLEIVCEAGDLVKLFAIIAIVMIVCMVILARIISTSNISSALKLGED